MSAILVICDTTSRSCWIPAHISKTSFGGLDSSFFLPGRLLLPAPSSNCRGETYRNANLWKKEFTEVTYESKSTADIHLPHSNMCFHQKIVMDS